MDTNTCQATFDQIRSEIERALVGQTDLVEHALIGVLTGGHVLLEGVPGLAKTLAVKTIADAVDCAFSRIQFTPDLLPADVVGTQVWDPRTQTFSVRKGPVFANVVLADEVNRAPAKVQSALLEAMQERQVTLGDQTFPVPDPFIVLATQNPIEQAGTYPLPEAQVDRFMLKVKIGYPTRDEELAIMRSNVNGLPSIAAPVVTPEDILRARNAVQEIYMDEKVERYILDIVFATRSPKEYKLNSLAPLISYGASPRASINLALGAKAYAFIKRRGYVVPEDVRAVSLDVLRHRVAVTYEAEAEEVTSEQIVQEVLNKIEVP